MEVSLYQAAAAMNATERWQEIISDNLATASVPGARKQEISFSAIQAGLASNAAGAATPGYLIPAANAVTNFHRANCTRVAVPWTLPWKAPVSSPSGCPMVAGIYAQR